MTIFQVYFAEHSFLHLCLFWHVGISSILVIYWFLQTICYAFLLVDFISFWLMCSLFWGQELFFLFLCSMLVEQNYFPLVRVFKCYYSVICNHVEFLLSFSTLVVFLDWFMNDFLVIFACMQTLLRCLCFHISPGLRRYLLLSFEYFVLHCFNADLICDCFLQFFTHLVGDFLLLRNCVTCQLIDCIYFWFYFYV